MKNTPQFGVHVPEYLELDFYGRQRLCEVLPELDLEEFRRKLGLSKNFARADSADTARRIPGPPWHILIATANDPPLTFHVYLGQHISVLVSVTPQDFDRTDPEHETLFRKCLDLLDIISEVEAQGLKVDVRVGDFTFEFPVVVGEMVSFQEIRSRWPAE